MVKDEFLGIPIETREYVGDAVFIHAPLIHTTNDSAFRAWENLVGDHPIVKIQFPNPESHFHFKWRMFKQKVYAAIVEVRFRLSVLVHGYTDECYD